MQHQRRRTTSIARLFFANTFLFWNYFQKMLCKTKQSQKKIVHAYAQVDFVFSFENFYFSFRLQKFFYN